MRERREDGDTGRAYLRRYIIISHKMSYIKQSFPYIFPSQDELHVLVEYEGLSTLKDACIQVCARDRRARTRTLILLPTPFALRSVETPAFRCMCVSVCVHVHAGVCGGVWGSRRETLRDRRAHTTDTGLRASNRDVDAHVRAPECLVPAEPLLASRARMTVRRSHPLPRFSAPYSPTLSLSPQRAEALIKNTLFPERFPDVGGYSFQEVRSCVCVRARSVCACVFDTLSL
jgi:hypothetical protein